MTLDTSKVGTAAARLMDHISEQFEDHDEARVGVVGLVVEVDLPGTGGDDPGHTYIAYQCSDKRIWIQSAIFAAAAHAVMSGD